MTLAGKLAGTPSSDFGQFRGNIISSPRTGRAGIILNAYFFLTQATMSEAKVRCACAHGTPTCIDYERMNPEQRVFMIVVLTLTYLYIFYAHYPRTIKCIIFIIALGLTYLLVDEMLFDNYDLEDLV